MLRINWRVLGLVMVLLLVALPLTAQDDEPDLQVPNLGDNTTFEDFFTAAASSQLYSFNGTAGDSISISMTQISDELDPFLVLLGSAGQVLTYDDDGGDKPLASRISDFELPVTDTYYIFASTFTFVSASNLYTAEEPQLDFEITLEGLSVAAEEGDEFIYFGSDLFNGIPFDGYSTESEPVYFFTFVAQAGQTATININSNELDTALHLFGPGGWRIAADDDSGDGSNARISDVLLEQDGLYLVFGTTPFFYTAADGMYTDGEFVISVNLTEAPADAGGDAAADATPEKDSTK